MNDLHIALQDGFSNDTVIITVNGREIYNKAGVTTNLVISLADTVTVPIDSRAASVKIDVASKKLSREVALQVIDTPYLGVALSPEGGLAMTPSTEPFRYF